MTHSDECEIELTREFFRDHGLLPDVPAQFDSDEPTEQKLLEQILTSPTNGAHIHSARWQRFGLIAAAVMVLAVAGGMITVLQAGPATAAGTPVMLRYSGGNVESVDSAPSATDVLATAARAAAVLSRPAAPGPVQYIASYGWLSDIRIGAGEATNLLIYPTITQWWLGPDGSVRVDERRGSPLDVDGQLTDADGLTRAMGDTSETQLPGSIPADLAARLPTEPGLLGDALLSTQSGLPCNQDPRWRAECLISAVQAIFQQYVATPTLVSAMWRVLADEPVLRSLGSTVDRFGRPAEAIALPAEPGQSTKQVVILLLSATTGAYLGSETVTVHNASLGIDTPTVTGFTELRTALRVASPGDTA